ncbi:DUF4280 domain-containing protein [Marinisporobacter balticus]|uniref:Uncharacterized protein DUF4280 n=1 Tax=Marinisporobacter balticus TaxID=2018667 RepID=A0A4R2KMW9_9FIRM|nr:DUF4280 domain-containing protein [Marinisporobacter balticus]TCO67915.1 uncharacterized protein DUF4280 [Marinisporobacter balticus]
MAIYKVKEGATLSCTLGTATSELKVPQSHGARMQGKNQATIADHVGNVNIMSFSMCTRVYPPVACTPSIALKWINGKKDFKIRDELALLNICIVPCMHGGIIKIQQSGQSE